MNRVELLLIVLLLLVGVIVFVKSKYFDKVYNYLVTPSPKPSAPVVSPVSAPPSTNPPPAGAGGGEDAILPPRSEN